MIGTNVNRRTIKNIEKAGFKVVDQTNLMTSMVKKLTLSPQKRLEFDDVHRL